jgi:hypothetical protein
MSRCSLLHLLLVLILATLPRLSAARDPADALLPALAGSGQSAVADPERVLREELRGVLTRLVDTGAVDGSAPDRIALTLALPAERVVDLGLVLDRRDAGEGLVVLGVRPGGLGAELGIASGDRLLAVDGRALGRGETAVADLRRALDAAGDGSRLRVTLLRGERRVELEGGVRARYLPPIRIELGEGALLASTAPLGAAVLGSAGATAAAESGCGRISVFHVAPRSQQLYAAKILELDGRIPGPATQDTFRVAAGTHQLVVAEQIDDQDLPSTFSRQRMRARFSNKPLAVEVEPNRTVLIAARLLDTRASDASRYWEPVAWKVIDEPCR